MSKKVLVIDDEPEIVTLLTKRLKSNYDVISANDGGDGLIKVKAEKPDLIILDLVMPNMDGHSFVLTLKNMPDYKNTPVIILSANETLQDVFKLEGVSHYFTKPYDAEQLLKAVKSLLKE